MSEAPRIFVGSSSKKKTLKLANQICEDLAKAGFTPRHWEKVFGLGDYTMEVLLREARTSDGAIFLFTADDTMIAGEEEVGITRDNVIFEAGLFTSVLGTKRSIIFHEKGVKLPSDFFGVTVKTFVEAFPNVEPIVAHFEAELGGTKSTGPQTLGDVPIYQDYELTRELLGSDDYPKDWTQRLVYIGPKGAKNWLNVVHGSDHAAKTVAHATRQAVKNAVNNIEEVDTFISFGPGDGGLDKELITALSNRLGAITYIPVDINIDFTKTAIMEASPFAHVPFGIVADFEDRFKYVMETVGSYKNGCTVFSLLGYTLDNLDRAEDVFVTNVKNHMKTGDYLLLDLSVQGPQWSPDKEKVMNPPGYSPEYKRFFATSIARRLHECFHTVMSEFDTRIGCLPADRSKIGDSKVLLVVDNRSRLELFKFTRHNYKDFLEWLEKNLRLKIVFKHITPRDGVADFAVVLARKT